MNVTLETIDIFCDEYYPQKSLPLSARHRLGV